jgi:hypothetical protein
MNIIVDKIKQHILAGLGLHDVILAFMRQIVSRTAKKTFVWAFCITITKAGTRQYHSLKNFMVTWIQRLTTHLSPGAFIIQILPSSATLKLWICITLSSHEIQC